MIRINESQRSEKKSLKKVTDQTTENPLALMGLPALSD